MDFNFRETEAKWSKYWQDNQTYKVEIDRSKPKYYVLDMFPYPSGAGLHVGHPLGYIASDIVSRYKRMSGYCVLHPMGFDAFGLPAEQYAIEKGKHPAETTAENIAQFRKQLDKIGFSYDWNREVQTCDPKYYKWTQWIFIQIFNSWYDKSKDKAQSIDELVKIFESEGNASINAATSQKEIFSANEWKSKSEKQQQEILMNYRLMYQAFSEVNWCPALGTVLANDEVKDGLSERGGFPVEKMKMRQWFMRITAYAERLLNDLESLEWSDAMKDMQRNWIGKSYGAEIEFRIQKSEDRIKIFTTRPDTIFGASFMVLAPEHDLVDSITTPEQKSEIEKYKTYVKSRTERDRLAETKKVTGAFTGAYATNPLTEKEIPIWISEYVLAGYGTGAIMAVPGHDERDHAFAAHFELPIIQVVEGADVSDEANAAKDGIMINSGFINGMKVSEAIEATIREIEKRGIGKRMVNYKLRDAGFSRQRYWGEPFPVIYRDDMPYVIDEKDLPLELPELNDFKPTGTGKSPLAKLTDWVHTPNGERETDTMPGYAGSSWYFLRYMDPHNEKEFVSKEKENYWQDIDLYIGGAEHAVGHLLYSRFWHKFFYDTYRVSKKEPFKQLMNQGMIQGRSSFVYRLNIYDCAITIINTEFFVSKGIADKILIGEFSIEDFGKIVYDQTSKDLGYDKKDQPQDKLPELKISKIHVDVALVENDELNIEAFKRNRINPDEMFTLIITEDGKYYCGSEVEKMSKSKLNVVNPDDVVEKYGADVFRMYEMFLGPLDQAKPWDTKGIDGVSRFIRKLWRLFYEETSPPTPLLEERGEERFDHRLRVIDEEPTSEELKILHKTIKKVREDIERFSFNTAVSAFMICVNELSALNCNKRKILTELVKLVAPFAPFVAEELWAALGNKPSVIDAPFPQHDESIIAENSFEYPISINGKTRSKINLPIGIDPKHAEIEVMKDETVQKWLNGATPKKVIFVPNRIINIVA